MLNKKLYAVQGAVNMDDLKSVAPGKVVLVNDPDDIIQLRNVAYTSCHLYANDVIFDPYEKAFECKGCGAALFARSPRCEYCHRER